MGKKSNFSIEGISPKKILDLMILDEISGRRNYEKEINGNWRNLRDIISKDPFLDLWFDSYFKDQHGHSHQAVHYTEDPDLWGQTHYEDFYGVDFEELGIEEDEDGPGSKFNHFYDNVWNDILNYIVVNNPDFEYEEEGNNNGFVEAINYAVSEYLKKN